MKRKETVDDRAVKDASAIQRDLERDKFPEMEDREGYAKQKQLKKRLGKISRKPKKEAREDREKTNAFIRLFEKLRNMLRKGTGR
jgi:hypothetical protein